MLVYLKALNLSIYIYIRIKTDFISSVAVAAWGFGTLGLGARFV